MNVIEAIEDPNLFRTFLADDKGELSTWANWLVALKAIHGLPIKSKRERELILQCTGRRKLRRNGFSTTLLLTGRRSGKSRTAAIAGAYEAVLAGHEAKLSKGERGIVLICAPTKPQSRIVRDYIRAIFNVPILQHEVVGESKEGFELKNGNRIEILAGDWRTVRGYTLIAAIVDEAAFFGYDTESKVKSDTELIRAIQPSLATVRGRLIAISSPYAMKGWCYGQYKRNFGNDAGKVLVWNCPSRTMNPALPQSLIDEALEEDLASAKAEYLGEFRDDVATFLPREVIEAVVVKGRLELAPNPSHFYFAFADVSGGRVDDAALAIAHRENGKVIQDFIRRWKPPFSPDEVIGAMVSEVTRYGIGRVIGDNYSAEFVKQSFESRGIDYERATTNPWSDNPSAKIAKPKSQLYLELLPRLCSGEIELLDDDATINQLAGLERRTRSGGKDKIDHGPNQHDDLANVVAGVVDCTVQEAFEIGAIGQGHQQTSAERAVEDFEESRRRYIEDELAARAWDEHRAIEDEIVHRISGGRRGRGGYFSQIY